METDYSAWQFWIGVGQLLINVMIGAYLWFSRKHQATIKLVKDTVDTWNANKKELEIKIEAVEKDVIQVQTELKYMPTQNQLQNLNKNMGTLEGELKEVKGRLEGINRVADLMNEYLINKEKSNG